jgi:hypothetical protein
MGILDDFFQLAQNAASGGSAILGKCTVSVAGGDPPEPKPPAFSGKIGKTFGDNNFLVFVLLARQNVFDPSLPGEYEFLIEGSNMGEPVSMNSVSDPVPGFSAPQQNEVKFVRTAQGVTLTLTLTIP